jgi:hypothetical protein
MAHLEDYLYPEGLENAPDPLVVDWDRPLSDGVAGAFDRLADFVDDVKDERGLE